MKFLSSIISDNSGGGSSIRVLMLFWGIILLSSWSYVSIKTTALAPIPESVIVVFMGLVGSKVAQRGLEKPEPEQPPKV